MRKLASIRRINDIRSIPNADAIEVVQVDGWNVVAKKGEFAVGDLCVYFEIDSVLPVCEEFEFLRKGCYVQKEWLRSETNPEGEGFRLKTIKLRGQVSQGLVIPLDTILDSYVGREVHFNEHTWLVAEGEDITDYYGIVKWDPPLPATLSGKAKGNFPSFIPKTDQERIQNVPQEVLDRYSDELFEVTIKLDGSSMTVYSYEGRVGVCSRNLELDYINSPETTFAKVFVESGLAEAIKDYPGIAIQGELMGPGIQGNRENLKDHQFYVFDVYDIMEGRYLSSQERLKVVATLQSKGVKIYHCPIMVDCRAAAMTKEEVLEMAEGPSVNNAIREGLVFKSIENPDFSFKAISNKFLLKGGE